MFQEHVAFQQPESDDVPLWRYMDFTKLLLLLDSAQLFFPRADKLGDPFEGSWPKGNVADRLIVPPEIKEEFAPNYVGSMGNIGRLTKAWTTYAAISCWHMNEHESAAMWKLYLSSNQGVAVKSIYSRFRESFLDDEPVYIGIVNYIDYENDRIPRFNLVAPLAHKRKSFEHEREARAVVLRMPDFSDNQPFNKPIIGAGIPVRVDIEKLITKIHVAPTAPRWFFNLVITVVKRWGYKFEVCQSDMDIQPVY